MSTESFRPDRRKLLAAVAFAPALSVAAQAGAEPSAAASDGVVRLPARTIAPPASISEAARAYLRKGANASAETMPRAGDLAGWRSYVEQHDGAMLRRMGGGDITLPGLKVETASMGGVTVFVVTPKDAAPDELKPHLAIHGGGWTSLGGKIARVLGQVQAQQYGGKTYVVDYRRPPDHPFPAPLDDCLAVYAELLKLHPAEKILVAGGSAGANLSAALMLKARDAGLPQPGAMVLENPIVDLNATGDTLQTNQLIDTVLKTFRRDENIAVYAGGADVSNPYLSPLFGDLSRGFPPTYLRTGTRDLFLSDTVRFHAALRKAGVEADLYVGEAMPHGGFGTRTPEDEDARKDALRWLAKHWA